MAPIAIPENTAIVAIIHLTRLTLASSIAFRGGSLRRWFRREVRFSRATTPG